MLHRFAGALLVTAGLLGCGPTTLSTVIKEVGPVTVRGPLAITPIEFRSLQDGISKSQKVSAERGRLTVPMRRHGGDSSEISIHYVRFPGLVSRAGLEPATYGLKVRCSTN